MITIGKPPPIYPTTPTRKADDNTHVADSKQARDSLKRPTVERRKQKDRRREQRQDLKFESRSGKDRRKSGKNSGKPSIDIIA